jgi:maltose O-acetyltransferase
MSEQKERMLRGELYLANDPEIQADALRCDALLGRFNATRATDVDVRRAILVELLGDIGEGAVIRPPLFMDYGYQTTIGAGTFINANCVILDVGRVRVGEDVQIGPSVQLLTPTHPTDPEQRRTGLEAAEPITIGDNVWLGGGVIVLPGVTIGRDTVVGAGAVVTNDLPAGVVALGNPARVIRTLSGRSKDRQAY